MATASESERLSGCFLSAWENKGYALGGSNNTSPTTKDLKTGNQGWFGQLGTTTIPTAFSFLISYKTQGITEKGESINFNVPHVKVKASV